MENTNVPPLWETELTLTGVVKLQKRILSSSSYQLSAKRFRPWGPADSLSIQPDRRSLGDITNIPRKAVTQPRSPELKTKERADQAFHVLSSEQRVLVDIHARPMFKARPVPRSLHQAPVEASDFSRFAHVRKSEEQWNKSMEFVPPIPFKALPLSQEMLAGPTFTVKYETRHIVSVPPLLHTEARALARTFSCASSLDTSFTSPVTPQPIPPTQSNHSLRDHLRQLLGKMPSDASEPMDVDQLP
jgi:hypothetical protein